MFNTTNIRPVSNVSTHVNAVTGNIVKTYADSYFKRFHLKSKLADVLFTENSDTIVIQMTMCGDMDVIAELISRKKYEQVLSEGVNA